MHQFIVEMLDVLHFDSKINYTIVAARATFHKMGIQLEQHQLSRLAASTLGHIKLICYQNI